MPDFRNEMTIETGVGQVKVASLVSADDLVEDQVSLKAINFKPMLPPGMDVKKCTAVLLTVDSLVEIQNLSFSLSINSKTLGSLCTGQGLDAQEWSDNGKLVVIGTEDGSALSYRFPKLRYEDKVVVDFTQHSLRLDLSDLPKLNRPSFHFIIAENDDPEPVEASAWFAVDQGHEYLLAQ